MIVSARVFGVRLPVAAIPCRPTRQLPNITDFKLADTNNDGKISQAEFKNACKLGLVQSASNSTMPKSQTR